MSCVHLTRRSQAGKSTNCSRLRAGQTRACLRRAVGDPSSNSPYHPSARRCLVETARQESLQYARGIRVAQRNTLLPYSRTPPCLARGETAAATLVVGNGMNIHVITAVSTAVRVCVDCGQSLQSWRNRPYSRGLTDVFSKFIGAMLKGVVVLCATQQ